ncbi:MAG TPA: ABC transporter permease/substrate-binding protein [Pyrinomonadaceae bacterium]|nr:ABC transporter permease/substrate-binding protein [Pyrinomonadaceae bacterium]
MSVIGFIAQHWREMLVLMREHFILVVISTTLAVGIAVPVGILLTRRVGLKRPVLALTGILQTVPSLALFGLLIPLPFIGGIGTRTAIVALVLYALLPVLRNTVTGIEGVDRSVREAAVAMGMTDWQVLRQVELPLASSVILAGVRVATVISIGVATIAAAIGAGGLGTYIFRGLRMNDNNLILAGAVPAALMALVADWLIGLLETRLDVSRRRAAAKHGWRRASPIIIAALVVAGAFVLWRAGSLGGNYSGAVGIEGSAPVVVGSKDFTEQVILGEIIAQTLEAAGLKVERRFELGGNLCHDALVAGRIDFYPEYSGTSFTAILKHAPVTDPRAVYEQITRDYAERFDIEVSAPLGFRNDFAILVRGRDARALNLRTISDAAPHARKWRAGFGQDFMSRPDGYEGFRRAYGLQLAAQPREMDLSLTYRALAAGEVDIIAGNSTDGLIAALDLTQLEDNRRYFPPYEAVILSRRSALERSPAAREALARLAGAISTEEMRRLNYEVDGRKRAASEVVREWIQSKGQK